MMVEVRFLHADGEGQSVGRGDGDTSLLTLAQSLGLPLEGTCEGQMACSTCHVIVDPAHFALLPPAKEAEEDMLDFAAGACRTSRLSCQILLGDCPPELIVKLPRESRDMQGL